MNPYSDLPEWMWEVDLGGFPSLYRSRIGRETDRMYHARLWRWVLFLEVEQV